MLPVHRADDPNVKKKKEEQLYPSTYRICFQLSIKLIQDGRQEHFNHPPFQFLCGGRFILVLCCQHIAQHSALVHTQNITQKTSKNQRRKDLIFHLKGVPLTCNQGKENYSLFLKSQCSYFVIYKHTHLKNLLQYKLIST